MSPASWRLLYPELIGAHARHRARKAALIDDQETLTYSDLWILGQRMSTALRHRIRPGSRVLIAMTPGVAQIPVFLGVWLAGGVVCPVNTRLVKAEIQSYARPLAAELAIVSESNESKLEGAAESTCVAPDLAASEHVAAQLEGGTSPKNRGSRMPEEAAPALIIGTGGTTGIPKGATFSHRKLWLWASSVAHIQEKLEDDRALYISPFFYSTVVTHLLTDLFVGGTVRVLPTSDPELIRDAVLRESITTTYAPPILLDRLTDGRRGDSGRMRLIAYGSMKAQSDLPDRLRRLYPGVRLITGYGATEIGPIVRLKGPDVGVGPSTRVGKVASCASVELEDEKGNAVEPGAIGEIVAQSVFQMDEYWGDDEKTRDAIGAQGIRMGDIARFDEDGYLHLMGRSKELISSGGEKVWPAEVELVLSGHPDVAEVAIYGVADAEWGERVEAAVVARGDRTLSISELRDFGRGKLASFKLPRSLRLVKQIPRTSIGKVDRTALVEPVSSKEVHGSTS